MTKQVPEKLVADLEKSREKLRLKKPRVYEKLMRYLEEEKKGSKNTHSLIDLAVDLRCNFSCPHCCAQAFQKAGQPMTMSFETLKRVADQADECGFFIINLIGGEPLVWQDLDRIIGTIGADRFHISLTTNGWLLTAEVAQKLAALGVDKIGISIDSGIQKEHDLFRNKNGSFERTLEGIRNAKDANVRTIISTVVTHQNIHSEGFERMLLLAQELEVGLDLQCATVSGGWRGNYDVLLNAEDAAYLETLRERYPLLRRDVWSTPGSEGGCPAVTRSVYIIPSGDVLPCLFIHISLGNICNEPLQAILERGLTVPELKNFSAICLAGEDIPFIDKYLSRTFKTSNLPLDFKTGFCSTDNPDPKEHK